MKLPEAPTHNLPQLVDNLGLHIGGKNKLEGQVHSNSSHHDKHSFTGLF